MKREFYVGYLPLPSGIKRGLWVLLPALVLAGLVVAVVLPTEQEDPGEGVWDLSNASEFTGIAIVDPYPMVVVSEDDGELRTVLLSSQIKTGVRQRLTKHEGKIVTVRGNLAERDGRALLTLLDDEAAIIESELDAGVSVAEPLNEGRFEMTGQIIDPKCYLGAMKPGEGKIHKACATLCIKGGIPPMFMTTDANDNREVYLLTGPNGDAIFDEIELYIADPIAAQGTLETHGDLTWFKIEPETIKRLK